MNGSQYDLLDSIALRNAGEALVSENAGDDWCNAYRYQAERFLGSLARGSTFIGEDLRRFASPIVGPPPNHPNAWSANAGSAIRRWLSEGRIVKVGWQQMTRKTSHARQSPRYRVAG